MKDSVLTGIPRVGSLVFEKHPAAAQVPIAGVAGLLLPSGSEAGRLLARQLVDQLPSNPGFKRFTTEAPEEWSATT